MIKLNQNFMAELFKLMFVDIDIMRIAYGYLTYQLIPKEWVGYKFLFKEAVDQFTKRDTAPSLGVASQKFANNEQVQEVIQEIKNAQLVDREILIDQLEAYIKETEFELLSKKVHDLYAEGKRGEAIQVNADESKRIISISLRQTAGRFHRVFSDFNERMKIRRSGILQETVQKKVEFGIDKLDEISYGGADPGDTVLWIMRSGIGKALSLDSDIITPKGIVKMKDIKVGDVISDPNGKEQFVIAVLPQGVIDCYEVTFSDGTKVKCNDKHIWRIASRKNKNKWINVELGWILKNFDNYLIPTSVQLPIDRSIVDIQYIGKEEMQCISVSNEDGLFMTNNFIVTHNSTVLRWHGFCAALEGEDVLHIQLEGGVDACVDKYDQIWTSQNFNELKKGNIKKEDEKQILKTVNDMKNFGQDINVYGFEKFGEASMLDVRNLCLEYHKIYGKFPRLLIIDSLDLLVTGINKKLDNDPEFIKYKLQKNSQLLKDLAVEFKMVVITSTQASNVPMEIWNNEERVIDRSFTEGDKTLVKPYSFVFTGNMTVDENKNNKLRIYIDKLRDYKNIQKIVTIATDYDRGRFYHRGRTLESFYDIDTPLKPIEKKEKMKKGTKSSKSSSI